MKPALQQDMTVAVPSNISVRGWPTEAGSNALTGYKAVEDATIVRRLREAGAHLRSSAFVGEFGFGLPVGGAAAVAPRPSAGGAEAADGAELLMDFMGESRLAAAHASIYGLKPSYGLVSRFGLIGLIPSMECCGILSGSLNTIGEVLMTVAGQDGLDFSLPEEDAPDFSPREIRPEEITIGIITEAQSMAAGAERSPATGDSRGAPTPRGAEGFRASMEELRRLGFTLREVSLPGYELFSLVHRVVGSVEASSAAGRYDSVRYGPRAPGAKNWNEMYLMSRGAAFGTLIKSYLIQGAFFQFERYEAFIDVCRIRARLVEDMRRLESEVDFFVLPMDDGPAQEVRSGAGAPPSLAGLYESHASTLYANVTGQPALYLPPVPGSAPTGSQLTGPRLSDGRLLDLGRFISESWGGE